MHTRRSVTRALAGLSAASFASACASTSALTQRPPRPYLAPVLVDESRIIRIDVGLRPYRPSGFRVEREEIGAKTIVHNYGHGGGGITLSWGTSKLALDAGYDPAQTDYAIIGAGAVGLATARLLQERGANVRLYARELSPNTTSNVAGAQWWPASVYDHALATDACREQLSLAAHFSHRRFQSLVGDQYGIAWEPNYTLSDQPIDDYPAGPNSPLRDLVINLRDLEPEQHAFAQRYVRQFDTMMVETPHYLRRLEQDVRLAGGSIEVRGFTNAAELQNLPERTIFNCSGLGAGLLFGDTEITPVRGQLVILEPQPEINYNVLANGLYMFGRRDGILLGGTFEHGEYSLTPDPDAIQRILNGHKAIFAAMNPTAQV